MGGGSWIFLAVFAGYIAYLLGLATGKFSLGVVRDERDSMYTRWFLGGLSVVAGAVIALDLRSSLALVIGAGMVVSGTAVIATARRRAPFDRTNRVPDYDVSQVARGFVFDSRPPARGPIEAYPKGRWTAFAAVAALVFTAVLVGLGVATFLGEPDRFPAMLTFLVVMSALLVVVLIGPSIWWVQRAWRGIPMVKIDSYGITLGRDRATDLSMPWDDMQAIEVRMMSGGGIRDYMLIVHPDRPGWLGDQPRRWRIYARISRALLGGHFAISTVALTVPLPELLARIAAYRPSLVSPESPAMPPGAPFETPSN